MIVITNRNVIAAVDCPTCTALAGSFCVGVGADERNAGKEISYGVHFERHTAYELLAQV
jgi:hypothetical protein